MAGSGGAGGATNTLPCDVVAVLKAKCQTCHSNPPQNDAPVPLVSYADVQGKASQIAEFIDAQVDYMPPPGAPNLTSPERTTLLNYIGAGLPSAGAVSCP
jgi:hypothetical protein